MEPPDVVLLDFGPLGLVSHPNAEKVNAEAVEWLEALLTAWVSVLVAEIADYEVRRELLRAGRQRGVQRLDTCGEAKVRSGSNTRANGSYQPATQGTALESAPPLCVAR